MSKIAWIVLLIIGFLGGIIFSRYDVPFFIIIASIVLSFYSLKDALIMAFILSLSNELNLGFGIGSGIAAFLISSFIVVTVTRFVTSQHILVKFVFYMLNIVLATVLYYFIIEFRFSTQVVAQSIDIKGLIFTIVLAAFMFFISSALITEQKTSYYEVKE